MHKWIDVNADDCAGMLLIIAMVTLCAYLIGTSVPVP